MIECLVNNYYPPTARSIKAFLIEGTLTKQVALTAVKTIAIAAKGNASGSSIKDATPKPKQELPIASPLLTGSLILSEMRDDFATVAPNIPVKTTFCVCETCCC